MIKVAKNEVSLEGSLVDLTLELYCVMSTIRHLCIDESILDEDEDVKELFNHCVELVFKDEESLKKQAKSFDDSDEIEELKEVLDKLKALLGE